MKFHAERLHLKDGNWLKKILDPLKEKWIRS